jgi:hypothetical protein
MNPVIGLAPEVGPRLTSLAKKYTHPTSKNHRVISGTGKSGMTPLGLPLQLPSPRLQRRNEELDTYQRNRFKGFSTQELEDLQAFASSHPLDSVPETTNPVNPPFDHQKWASSKMNSVPFLLLPGSRDRYWEVGHEDSVLYRC